MELNIVVASVLLEFLLGNSEAVSGVTQMSGDPASLA